MSESPDSESLLSLDGDVLEFLRALADRHYAGNVSKAMNDTLRAVMLLEMPKPANDPMWVMLKLQNMQRQTNQA